MPPPFQKHVFVCTNLREATNPKGSCAAKGSEALPMLFKQALEAQGIKKGIRINKAGCLDACERGCTVVVYPDNVWYGGVTKDDVKQIVEEHLVAGRVVERLKMKPYEP
jgi:(2Fe-2S) ferredoxin